LPPAGGVFGVEVDSFVSDPLEADSEDVSFFFEFEDDPVDEALLPLESVIYQPEPLNCTGAG
jgi:hypothetical protein